MKAETMVDVKAAYSAVMTVGGKVNEKAESLDETKADERVVLMAIL